MDPRGDRSPPRGLKSRAIHTSKHTVAKTRCAFLRAEPCQCEAISTGFQNPFERCKVEVGNGRVWRWLTDAAHHLWDKERIFLKAQVHTFAVWTKPASRKGLRGVSSFDPPPPTGEDTGLSSFVMRQSKSQPQASAVTLSSQPLNLCYVDAIPSDIRQEEVSTTIRHLHPPACLLWRLWSSTCIRLQP